MKTQKNGDMLTMEELKLLREIAASKWYTLVRLELRNTKESSLRSTALNHVHLERSEECLSMEAVKSRSALIVSLEVKEMIKTDYALFATLASHYAVYQQSSVYQLLCELVKEGKSRPGFLFDVACIKRGRAVLTEKGKQWTEN